MTRRAPTAEGQRRDALQHSSSRRARVAGDRGAEESGLVAGRQNAAQVLAACGGEGRPRGRDQRQASPCDTLSDSDRALVRVQRASAISKDGDRPVLDWVSQNQPCPGVGAGRGGGREDVRPRLGQVRRVACSKQERQQNKCEQASDSCTRDDGFCSRTWSLYAPVQGGLSTYAGTRGVRPTKWRRSPGQAVNRDGQQTQL